MAWKSEEDLPPRGRLRLVCARVALRNNYVRCSGIGVLPPKIPPQNDANRSLGDSFCHPSTAKSPPQQVRASRPNPLDLGGSCATSNLSPGQAAIGYYGAKVVKLKDPEGSIRLFVYIFCRDTEPYKVKGCPILIRSYFFPNDYQLRSHVAKPTDLKTPSMYPNGRKTYVQWKNKGCWRLLQFQSVLVIFFHTQVIFFSVWIVICWVPKPLQIRFSNRKIPPNDWVFQPIPDILSFSIVIQIKYRCLEMSWQPTNFNLCFPMVSNHIEVDRSWWAPSLPLPTPPARGWSWRPHHWPVLRACGNAAYPC